MYQLLSEPKYINITFNAPTNQSAIKVGADAINQGGNERH
jgi:hypothetical protein